MKTNIRTKRFALSGRFWPTLGLPWWQSRICLQCWTPGFDPCVGKLPWRRNWQHIAVFFPRESKEEPGRLWSIGLQRVDTTEATLQIYVTTQEKHWVSYGRLVCSSADQWEQGQAPLSGTHTVNDFIFNCCLTKMIALASFWHSLSILFLPALSEPYSLFFCK